MLASAHNGFMNTSIADCSGTPWSFRPLYSTAKTINQGGWAAANINVAYEIGHTTPCTRLQGLAPVRWARSRTGPGTSAVARTRTPDRSNASGGTTP
jgi:hypothetical protein